MTPPPARRQSYARRNQYGTFAAYVVAATGAMVALLCAVVWAVDPVGFAALRTAANGVTAPVARGTGAALGSVGNIDDEIAAFWRAGSQNAELNRELTAARRELITARALRNENEQLRELLGLTRARDTEIAAARLLTSTAASARRFAIIDVGSDDGVRPGQPVRSADGLIGRTLDVGGSVTRIMLISDPQSVIPVRRASDGLAALATGTGATLIEIRPLNSATNILRVGDILLTSGSGGLYQPRTPLAVVIRLTDDGALARPIADPAITDAVIVERAADAGLSLPPAPEGAAIAPTTAAP
jgi:rod shape-determining protein MreC